MRSRVLAAMLRLMRLSDKMFIRNATASVMTATVTEARKSLYLMPSMVILTVRFMLSQGWSAMVIAFIVLPVVLLQVPRAG